MSNQPTHKLNSNVTVIFQCDICHETHRATSLSEDTITYTTTELSTLHHSVTDENDVSSYATVEKLWASLEDVQNS